MDFFVLSLFIFRIFYFQTFSFWLHVHVPLVIICLITAIMLDSFNRVHLVFNQLCNCYSSWNIGIWKVERLHDHVPLVIKGWVTVPSDWTALVEHFWFLNQLCNCYSSWDIRIWKVERLCNHVPLMIRGWVTVSSGCTSPVVCFWFLSQLCNCYGSWDWHL